MLQQIPQSHRIHTGWWKIYLRLVKDSVDAGKGKWITAYPDLHTGIDGLAAIRGVERLMMDLVAEPDIVRRAMRRMTRLWVTSLPRTITSATLN